MDEVESEIRLFAVDCVCYRPIANVQDCEQLQKDIDHLTSWAKKWYMRFELKQVQDNAHNSKSHPQDHLSIHYGLLKRNLSTCDRRIKEAAYLTTLWKDLGWKSLKNRREVDRLCLLKRDYITMESCPWMNYQSRLERQDICTIGITTLFMLALTYSNSVFCATHLVEIADDAKTANCCYVRFSRNPLTGDVNNIIHLMNEVTWNG